MTGSEYVNVTQRSEYARICLDRVLSISEYTRVTQGFKYATIWLNMSE